MVREADDGDSRLKRTHRFIFRLLTALVAGAIVAAAAALWLIASGPVSLTFLKPYFEDALVLGGSGYRVALGDTQLAWGGWQRTIDLRALDVRVVGPDGELVAQAPEISVTLSAKALLSGMLAPTAIDLIRPDLHLVRNEDGRFALGAAQAQAAPGESMLAVLLGGLNTPPREGSALSYLTSIGIAEGTAWIEDRTTGAQWFAPMLNASMSRRVNGVSADLDLVLALDTGAVVFTATADYVAVPGLLTVAVSFDDLPPGTLLTMAGTMPPGVMVDGRVDGNVAALINRDGSLARIDFDFAAGPSVIDAPMMWTSPIGFDSLAMRGTVLDGLRTVRISDFFATQSGASAEASGLFTFDPAGLGFVVDVAWTSVPADRLDAMWPITLAPNSREWVVANVRSGMSDTGTLHMRVLPGELHQMPHKGEVDLRFAFSRGVSTYLPGQPPLQEVKGEGHLTLRAFDLTVESARVGTLALREGAVHIDGIDSPIPSMVIEFVASGTTAEGLRILALPPLHVPVPQGYGGAMAARTQIAMPIKNGLTAQDIKYAAAVNLRDLTIPLAMDWLALTGGTVSLRADANGVEAQGTMSVNGAPMQVDFRYPLRNAGPAVDLPAVVTARGVVSDDVRRRFGVDAGELLQGPVALTARVEFDWQMAFQSATFDADLRTARMDLPGAGWDKAVNAAGQAHFAVRPAADGAVQIADVAVQTPAWNGTGNAIYAPASRQATGTLALNGYDVGFRWRGAADGTGLLSAVVQADDKMLAEFGYPVAPWVTGPMPMALELRTNGVVAADLQVAANLRDAAVRAPLYTKEPGAEATANLGFGQGGGAFALRTFAVAAPGFSTQGTFAGAADGGWQRIDLAAFVLGETDTAASIERRLGGFAIEANGKALDVRPFLTGASVSPATQALPGIEFSGHFDRVQIADGRWMSDMTASALYDSGAWRRVNAGARLPNGSSVTMELADAPEGQDVTIRSADAGEFFSAMGLFQGATGGTAEIAGKLRDEGGRSLAGTVRAENFRIVRAPALARLLAVASLTGTLDTLQGQGISFSTFDAPFRINANTLTLHGSRAVGQALCITVEGEWSRADDQLNLGGVIVPVCPVNRLLGDIPLLGDLIVGEGFGATNYRVTGPVSAPSIVVNPLSTITPGFLRGLLFGNR